MRLLRQTPGDFLNNFREKQMSFASKRRFGGADFWIWWPIFESIMQNGMELTCHKWPDRVSDCRINGLLVSPIVYAHMKRPSKRRPPMTPERFRFRLKCYVAPLGRS
jgi:hypothetical protein